MSSRPAYLSLDVPHTTRPSRRPCEAPWLVPALSALLGAAVALWVVGAMQGLPTGLVLRSPMPSANLGLGPGRSQAQQSAWQVPFVPAAPLAGPPPPHTSNSAPVGGPAVPEPTLSPMLAKPWAAVAATAGTIAALLSLAMQPRRFAPVASTAPPTCPSAAPLGQAIAEALDLEETTARHRLVAEQRHTHSLLQSLRPDHLCRGAARAVGAAGTSLALPSAAHANVSAVPATVTPDLLLGVAGAAGMVGLGRALMAGDGHASHGPPEAQHPMDAASEPYPSTPDGAELATVFQEPYDIWRASLLRYLGYSNELGEAFRPLVGDFVANSTYAVAIAYVLADSVDKALRAAERSREQHTAAVFLQMDAGLHGRLSYEELRAMVQQLRTSLSTEELEAFLKRTDIRGDQHIDFDEFYLALKRQDPTLLKVLEAGAAALPDDVARPWRKALRQTPDPADVRTAVAGLDALLWQLTASVAMPGFTINRVVTLAAVLCAGLHASLDGAVDPAALQLLGFLPTLVGLLSITVIVHPLDTLADALFNATLRKHVFQKLPVDQSGQLTAAMMAEKLASRPDGQPRLPRDEALRLFAEVDTDRDGLVSLAEWRRAGLFVLSRYAAAPSAERTGDVTKV